MCVGQFVKAISTKVPVALTKNVLLTKISLMSCALYDDSNIQGGPANMHRLCMRINQSIFEIYLYLIP